MKLNNNQLNFCDYCTVTSSNAKEKITEDKCGICNKYFCKTCLPDDYNHVGHISIYVRNPVCKHCYHTMVEAHYRDSGFDAREAWPKLPRKELRASGSTSAVHLGEIMAFILDKHLRNAKVEALETLKEIHESSQKFLTKRNK